MALPANEHGSLSGTGVRIMLTRVVLCSLFLACAFTPANALTQEELLTRLEAATADRGGSGLLPKSRVSSSLDDALPHITVRCRA